MKARRRDENEQEIVDALIKAGCKVHREHTFDLHVLRRGRAYMLEVKTADGVLTPAQEEMLSAGWPLYIVRTPEEAIKAVGL